MRPQANTTATLAATLLLTLASCETLEVYGEWVEDLEYPEPCSAVVVNHVPLSPHQIAELELTYGVRAVPGQYWYDSRSGLYGPMGRPCHGQLQPGHDFGPLPRNASMGTTGVLLNGRELHHSETAYLSQYVGRIAPGAYWLDGFGNVGHAGDPIPVVNLYEVLFAGAPSPAPGGCDNTWSSMLASGNYTADQSSGYVHIRDFTGGPGIFVGY